MAKQKILIVDDDEGIQLGFSQYFSRIGYITHSASSLGEAKQILSSQKIDGILLDLRLPDGDGIDWIIELRELSPEIAIIVITGVNEIPVAVEAMRRGADHFLTKPINMKDLEVFLSKSLDMQSLRHKDIIQKRLAPQEEIFFGNSEKMKEAMHLASLAAQNDSPVLLIGETGAGKGLLARWIHNNSHRKFEPFVEVNCSALKGDLLSSEIFGHARGAFTSAVQDRQGLLEVADGGTFFLDEIGDMDVGVQAQFLKVIEEKKFRRLGETKIRESEFRIICATNQDLDEKIQNKKFRKDLFFRIYVFPIMLPPLRQRKEDLSDLIHYILAKLGMPHIEIQSDAMELLCNYSWPGNIRELRNVLERALSLSHKSLLSPKHFPGLEQSFVLDNDEILNLKYLEKKNIKNALDKFNGNVGKAAEALGLSRATLYRKLKEYDM